MTRKYNEAPGRTLAPAAWSGMSPPQVIMATHARLEEKGTVDPPSQFRFAGILMTHWPETTNCIMGHMGRKVSCNTDLL